jgi:L,D-transpeptidase YcbB
MWSRRFVWRCWLWVALLPGVAQADALLRGTVESVRDAESVVLEDRVPLWSGAVLAEFYRSRDYEPAWSRQADLDALLHTIEASPADGFDPADFHVETVRALSRPGVLDRLGRAERLAADLGLSDALLRYVHHIRFGRLDPHEVNRGWNHRPPIPVDTLIGDMASVLAAGDPQARLADLAPKPFFYRNLKRALAEYGGPARLEDLPQIRVGAHLSQGDRDPGVALIRERLSLIGDHRDPPPGEPDLFDESLAESLKAFQARVGLTADGVAGPSTVAALNRPYDRSKVEQIRINLERMRWFYDSLPEDYVLVDVAGFMAHVVRGGQVNWSTRVVVGTPQQQTPSFRDEMEHVIFNPTWTVPPSIQKKMRGAGRFKMVDRRTGRTVSGGNASDYRRYSLIQAAGPRNALGRVKFIFPNGQAVYLHDTPSKGLFSSSVRAFSHGCVRVQDPLKLAEVILDRPNWDQSEIKRVVARGRTHTVPLEEHLPVILYYLTAMADGEGKASFRRDIYGRDSSVRTAFAGEPGKARITFESPQPAANAAATPAKPSGVPDSAKAPPTLQPAPVPAPGLAPLPATSAPAESAPASPPTFKPLPRIEVRLPEAAVPAAALTLGTGAGAPQAPMEREAASRL